MKRLLQMTLFDDNNNPISQVNKIIDGSVLKDGWVFMYKQAINDLLDDAPTFAVIKIFFRLASMQSYEPIVYTTLSHVAKLASLNYKTAWQAMKWLKENNYVKVVSVSGVRGYLINPSVSGCGRSAMKARIELWSKTLQGDATKIEIGENDLKAIAESIEEEEKNDES